jgi:hypothetical protein
MAFHPFRTRLAALVLLIASPGFAGLAVDAAHPCPDKAPWTVEEGGHHHGQPTPEHHDCKCVGACQTAVAASMDVRDGLPTVVPLISLRPASFYIQLLSSGRPLDRLPPATAPPVA